MWRQNRGEDRHVCTWKPGATKKRKTERRFSRTVSNLWPSWLTVHIIPPPRTVGKYIRVTSRVLQDLHMVFRLIFVLIKSQIPTLSTLVSWPQVWPLGSLQAGPHVLSAYSLCQATESLPRTCPRLSLIFSTMAISSAIAPRHSSSSYVQRGLKD